ncbi:hypothetical protein BH09PSE2_BH09PSE2_12950 [soil metagenome]
MGRLSIDPRARLATGASSHPPPLAYPLPVLSPEQPCARCAAATAHDDLRVWTKRERLRSFRRRPAPVRRMAMAGSDAPDESDDRSGDDPGGAPFAYRWVTRAYVLCPACHGAITGGDGALLDHDRRRALLTCAAVLALTALMWFGFAPFTHNWIAAFWRNGAGGR